MPPLEPISAIAADDTIVAPATPSGRSALGLLRLSGPEAAAIGARLVPGRLLPPRRAVLGALVDERDEPVDEVLITLFPGPASYTGENVVEISCHGSPPVLRFGIERAVRLGARLAEPGEFTRRAFRNGRLDLVQAEAVRDLIDATTLYQARVATRQRAGALSAKLRGAKERLLGLIALLEAGIDFAEDDLEVAGESEILARLARLREEVSALAAGFAVGKIVRGGLKLAIIGRPNVGKSSLFNRLLERDRAIVTPVAGTTRDAISETASFAGIPVELIDTAGIRATDDAIESEGVQRSWQAVLEADCALMVVDLSEPPAAADQKLWERARQSCPALLVGNKLDLAPRNASSTGDLQVSAKTGAGVELLRSAIRERALPGLDALQEGSFVTNIRQEGLLRSAAGALDKASGAVEQRVPHEMLLLDLYEVLQALDSITGSTTLDDVLNRIFSTFCIGK